MITLNIHPAAINLVRDALREKINAEAETAAQFEFDHDNAVAAGSYFADLVGAGKASPERDATQVALIKALNDLMCAALRGHAYDDAMCYISWRHMVDECRAEIEATAKTAQ